MEKSSWDKFATATHKQRLMVTITPGSTSATLINRAVLSSPRRSTPCLNGIMALISATRTLQMSKLLQTYSSTRFSTFLRFLPAVASSPVVRPFRSSSRPKMSGFYPLIGFHRIEAERQGIYKGNQADHLPASILRRSMCYSIRD